MFDHSFIFNEYVIFVVSVVSFVSWELFAKQSLEYKLQVICIGVIAVLLP